VLGIEPLWWLLGNLMTLKQGGKTPRFFIAEAGEGEHPDCIALCSYEGDRCDRCDDATARSALLLRMIGMMHSLSKALTFHVMLWAFVFKVECGSEAR
jgi:hypothetical protein